MANGKANPYYKSEKDKFCIPHHSLHSPYRFLTCAMDDDNCVAVREVKIFTIFGKCCCYFFFFFCQLLRIPVYSILISTCTYVNRSFRVRRDHFFDSGDSTLSESYHEKTRFGWHL